MTLIKQNSLPKLNNDLKGLISLSNYNFTNLDETLNAYLRFGLDKTGFETGMVGKVKGNNYKIMEVIGSSNTLKKGSLVPLNDTFCKLAIDSSSILVRANVDEPDLLNLPVRKMLSINSIICTPIIVNQQSFGTLMFCSSKVNRNTDRWKYKSSLVEILGQSLSKILKEKFDKDALKAKSAYLEKFNNDLRALAKIGSTHYANFTKNLFAYINLAKKITGLEGVIVSEVKGNDYNIIEASTHKNELKAGDVLQLCDTLCQEVIEKQTTIAYPKLKDTKNYDASARIKLKLESSIMVPLRVEDKICGVVNFCSTIEQDDIEQFNYAITIAELIAEKMCCLIRKERAANELKKDKQLLKMGAEVFEMASYESNNDLFYATPDFAKIFDLQEELKSNTICALKVIKNKILKEDKKCFFEHIEKGKSQNIEPFEYRIRTKSGAIKWIRHQLQFDANYGYTLGVVQNITALKRVQEKLQEKNNELQQFAYATAHDLQEPLRTINGYSKVLAKTCIDKFSDTEKEYFFYIKNASIRMTKQIDGLLQHSRIGRKNEKQLINMDDLVQHVLSDLKSRIDETGAKILLYDLPQIEGYSRELHVLLLNLLSNAIKFVKPGIIPNIEIGYDDKLKHYWKFYIKDNGIGIAKENISKIFNLFGRLNNRDDFEGTGIGLTHCKKIVHLHDGEITVKSALGNGTRICFTLKK